MDTLTKRPPSLFPIFHDFCKNIHYFFGKLIFYQHFGEKTLQIDFKYQSHGFGDFDILLGAR